uniref:Uncharacterized protein n=2 Tax=Helianthus annuus TaxID=4232 RepID=A0A251RUS0_HELAN
MILNRSGLIKKLRNNNEETSAAPPTFRAHSLSHLLRRLLPTLAFFLSGLRCSASADDSLHFVYPNQRLRSFLVSQHTNPQPSIRHLVVPACSYHHQNAVGESPANLGSVFRRFSWPDCFPNLGFIQLKSMKMDKRKQGNKKEETSTYMDLKSTRMELKSIMKDIEYMGPSHMTWKEKKALENKNIVSLGGKPPKKPAFKRSASGDEKSERKGSKGVTRGFLSFSYNTHLFFVSDNFYIV